MAGISPAMTTSLDEKKNALQINKLQEIIERNITLSFVCSTIIYFFLNNLIQKIHVYTVLWSYLTLSYWFPYGRNVIMYVAVVAGKYWMQ